MNIINTNPQECYIDLWYKTQLTITVIISDTWLHAYFLEGCLGYPLSEDGTQMIYPEHF